MRKGLVKKKGLLRVETVSKKMEPIEGKVPDIKAIWQELQNTLRERNELINLNLTEYARAF